MAYTFQELVEKQQVANEAYEKAGNLRRAYGPPTADAQGGPQAEVYETALRAWRDLEREVYTAISDFAKEHGLPRNEVEDRVRAQAGPDGAGPQPEEP